MKLNKNFLQGILVVFFVSSFTLVGCDKIPFLSKFTQKKETKSTPAVNPTPGSEIPSNFLARVNNWTITLDEFNEKLAGLKEVMPEYKAEDLESRKLVLEELIRQELLVQDAEKSGIANEKDIAEAVKEFRRTLLVREVAGRITQNITVDDTEAENYYNENKDLFAEDVQWQVREIVVPNQSEANEILIELLKGTDFATMAMQRSKSASAPNGGDLGWISQASFPQLATTLSSLEKDSVSSVFKGPEGYYIVKLIDKKGGTPQPFSTVKEEIKKGLTLLKQQQEVLKYLDELRAQAKIEIKEDLLK